MTGLQIGARMGRCHRGSGPLPWANFVPPPRPSPQRRMTMITRDKHQDRPWLSRAGQVPRAYHFHGNIHMVYSGYSCRIISIVHDDMSLMQIMRVIVS
jgi:hypothetical protein